MISHNNFPRDGEHFIHMLNNFSRNDDIIETHNRQNNSFTLGHNKFSHLNNDEWRDYLSLGMKFKPNQSDVSELKYIMIFQD